MSLTSNNKQNDKKAKKSHLSNNAAGSKFIPKQGKASGFSKKPVKTGGTRGS
ncbi:MAG: hypothetical protein P0Y53_19345 [Candidatus Pseudobacter hemicellulosilyticus]|uniref:Uncharacterized protein n=1 Tax=Candidatus Pseudobacter hemicellulosilyticus TaxID=3121375 RepID=A0AAJ5WQ16_9BACT|nr:MAG: hypothetical protein P0Y53_19345 [Pseudobacter sp.]